MKAEIRESLIKIKILKENEEMLDLINKVFMFESKNFCITNTISSIGKERDSGFIVISFKEQEFDNAQKTSSIFINEDNGLAIIKIKKGDSWKRNYAHEEGVFKILK